MMALIRFICLIIGIFFLFGFFGLIIDLFKYLITKKKPDYSNLTGLYEKYPLAFLVIGPIIILLTVYTVCPAVMALLFSNNIKYKTDGIYCYYVMDKDQKTYPAKIDIIEGNYYIMELYFNEEVYLFNDEEEMVLDKYTQVITSYNSTNDEEVEKEFELKLLNDAAYCPSFGKGNTNNSISEELVLESMMLISEITVFIIIIYVSKKSNDKTK